LALWAVQGGSKISPVQVPLISLRRALAAVRRLAVAEIFHALAPAWRAGVVGTPESISANISALSARPVGAEKKGQQTNGRNGHKFQHF
jgi:hypothetical protein